METNSRGRDRFPQAKIKKMIQYHPDFLAFDHTSTLVETLSARIRKMLSESVHNKGHASLAVSGGTTPIPLFEALSHLDLEWDKVVVTLVDERWVEITDRDSNEYLVRRYLLKEKAVKARFIGMKTAEETAKAGEKACSQRLREVPLPFDALILGIGSDGHTASLFPGAKRLPAAVDAKPNRICINIKPQSAPHERMTLTLPAILNSSRIFIFIRGEEKRSVYAKAVSKGPPDEMPIRHILGQTKVPVSVYWAP